MSLFNRRQRTDSPPPVLPSPPAATLDLASALEIVLVRSVQSQADTASKIGQLVTDNVRALSEMQQDSYKRASRRRGGQIRGRSAKRTPHGKFARGCRLCENPGIGDPRKEEIIAHIGHQNPGMNYREENGAIHMDVPEAEVQTDAQGNEVVECAECATGAPHQHGRH